MPRRPPFIDPALTRRKEPRRSAERDVVLAATLHDPEGALVGDIRRYLPRLQRIYRDVVVGTSPGTAPALNRLLEERGVFIGCPNQNERGPLYRSSIRKALEAGGQRVHYLDFDRALHWARGPVEELEEVLDRSASIPVLLIGRTPTAHTSHQEALVVTETATNRYLADGLGLTGRVDFMVPSFLLRADAARTFLQRCRTRGMGIYGEMAHLLFSLGHDVAYVECDGLDWETPDRDRRVVARIGLPAYRDRFDRDDEWDLRHSLQREVEAVFDRSRAKLGDAGTRLRRLRAKRGSSPPSRRAARVAI